MDFEKFLKALDELKNSNGMTFPPLNSDLGGRGESSEIEVSNNTVYFKRNTAKESVKISDMKDAYVILLAEKLNKSWDACFKHECAKTFFLQLLQHYDLAKILGKGINGNPYDVDLK